MAEKETETKDRDCSCDVCTGACRYRPGYFAFGEAEATAQGMGMGFQEFFDKYLVVDYQFDKQSEEESDINKASIFLLAPATERAVPGTEAPADPQGKCIFFDEENKKCKIHEYGKPFECRKYIHTMNHAQSVQLHNETSKTWNNDEAKEQIKKLLGGREPQVTMPTMADILSMMLGQKK